METYILAHEPWIRLSFFFGVLTLMAVAEILAPRRALTMSKTVRWTANLGLVLLNTLVLRLLFPLAAVGLAAKAAQNGWGLLNHLDWPGGLELILAVLVLDFAIYLQHVMFHAVPVLWRLHRMHHADLDFDVTTGARFHPIEIGLSMLLKFTVIVALGPSALAVLIFEILLNVTAMFNHSNTRLPQGLDCWLRLLVVTPDMHRVHHSIRPHETNSNFGFNSPWWDRLCGTYRAQPEGGHEGMTIGIAGFRDPARLNLLWLLILPFQNKAEPAQEYAINRRSWE